MTAITTLFLICLIPLQSNALFTQKWQFKKISVYEDTSSNTRVVKRQHEALLPLPISENNLTGIAKVRFKMLKKLQPGLHNFAIHKVNNHPVKLGKTVVYVWQGSYKDKNGKMHFVTEFIGAEYTYNVFTDNPQSFKKTLKILKTVIKTS